MSIDKFGHYLNDTSGRVFVKNVPKLLGFVMDTTNNIDVQNKRIKNVAKALEENDVVNKLFLQSQIEEVRDEIHLILSQKLNEIRETISSMKLFFEKEIRKINELIYGYIRNMMVNST